MTIAIMMMKLVLHVFFSKPFQLRALCRDQILAAFRAQPEESPLSANLRRRAWQHGMSSVSHAGPRKVELLQVVLAWNDCG